MPVAFDLSVCVRRIGVEGVVVSGRAGAPGITGAIGTNTGVLRTIEPIVRMDDPLFTTNDETVSALL